MPLTQQQIEEMRNKYGINPISAPTKAAQSSNGIETGVTGLASDFIGDIKQVGSDIVSSFKTRRDSVQSSKQAQAQGKQTGAETLLQTTGQAAGLVSDVFGSLVKGGVKASLSQDQEDLVKKGISSAAEPIVNSDIVKSVISKYNSLDERSRKNLEATLGIGSLAFDVATFGVGKKAIEKGVKTSLELATDAVDAAKAAKSTVSKVAKPVVDTVENIGRKITDPDVPEAVKVSLNPSKALSGTGQDIDVMVGGKMKKLSQITPEENARIQVSTQKSLDAFSEQAQKFAKDRSVIGGSPVEIVGNRVDKVMDFLDKKRRNVGQKMGDIELKYADEPLSIGEKTTSSFADALKSFDNPKFGVDTADAKIVRKLVEDFDTLEKAGATIKDRLDFVRQWDKYLNDAKDSFGKFKENATANTRIQNAVKVLKDETVDAISNKDSVYRGLRSQYRTFKQLDEIADALLGKEGALGQRIKGAATVKRAIQSNSDAGARQFLTKLKELTGYDAIKEGDLALTAMEKVGDYQGLSLLNIVKEGKSGLINRALKFAEDKIVGTNAERVQKYIKNTPSTIKTSKDSGGLNLGLSIKNITKNISSAEKGTMRDFTDYVNGAYKPDAKILANLKRDVQEIADKYGFSKATGGDKSLSKQFGEYLDSVGFDKEISGGDMFHGTAEIFSKFDNGKSANGNLGKGIYITNDKNSARFYSMLSNESKQLKSGANVIDRSPKNVLTVSVAKGAKIKKVNHMPSLKEVEQIKKEGYDGIDYPDNTLNSLGEWDIKKLGNVPKNPRATIIFDSANVNIKK